MGTLPTSPKKRKAAPPGANSSQPRNNVASSDAETDAAINAVLERKLRKPAKAKTKPSKPAPKQPAAKKPVGRPSDYSQELADLICEALAEGHSLRSICQADNMPNKGTVFRWLATNQAFQDQYARSREAQADCLFDDILAIADDGRNDTYTDDDGNTRTDFDVIARSKLRVDARKWMAGKLRPKVYGDKVDVNHGGQEGNPVNVQTKVILVPPKQAAEVITRPLKKDGE